MAELQEWECQNCGNTITSKEQPETCPECGSDELLVENNSVEDWSSDDYEDDEEYWPEEEEEDLEEDDEEWW